MEYTETEKVILFYMFHNLDRVIDLCDGEATINGEKISFGNVVDLAKKLGVDYDYLN